MAFEQQWSGNVYEHYLQYGFREGVNPSNAFDNDAYLAAKLAALQAAGREITLDELKDAFADAGLTPITHFMRYGAKEQLQAPAVPAEEQVDPSIDPTNPGLELSLTTEADTLLAAAAALPEGKTEADVQRASDANDIIDAVASALSSARTLNADDRIDGGAGNDLLKVDVQGDFGGFEGNGGVVNVETIELTNTGEIARTVSAKGIEGAETFALNGAVNLAELGSTEAAVNLSGRDAGSAEIQYAAKVTDGKADALALGLNDIGTAEVKDAAGEVTTAEAAVALVADGIEVVDITATGTNVVLLETADAEQVNVEGTGSVKIVAHQGAVSGAVKSVDASGLQGVLDVNLRDAAGVTSVLAGAGDDIIRATPGDLAVNAEINGGEGADTLSLSGRFGVSQYQMAGVETVELNAAGSSGMKAAPGGLSDVSTFSGAESTGIEQVVVKGAGNAVKFVNLGMADLGVTLDQAASGEVAFDHAGATTLSVSGGTEQAETINTVNTVLTESADVTLVVEAFNTLGDGLGGKLVATKAEGLTAEIAGALNNTIELVAATSAVFNQTNTDQASTVALDAAKLNDLRIDADGAFTLAKGSDLSAVESLTIDAGQAFAAAGGESEGAWAVDFGSVAAVDLSGAGAESKITLSNLGGAVDYDITVNAEGLIGGLTLGDIGTGAGHTIDVNMAGVLGDVTIGDVAVTAADSAATGAIVIDANGTYGDITLDALSAKTVTVDASGAMGAVNVGSISGNNKGSTDGISGEVVTFTGSELMANTVYVTASEQATVSGGLGNDTFMLVANNAAGTLAEFTVSGGLGNDNFLIDHSESMSGSAIVTITDFNAGDTTNIDKGTLSVFTKESSADAGAAAAVLEAAGIVADAVAATSGVEFVGDANTFFTFDGNTYAMVTANKSDDVKFDDTNILVQLVGVHSADALGGAFKESAGGEQPET
ncbi:beta strand repeat-containing protein [Marichromatium bheemlicum]|uniref:beta strand repeat-containing protein n=1 Tax=Marichromatium bheemlicum TaxID=365339 RepID=UPI0014455B26|nr:hypothetical protein [Marichromatium bheemlicum]